MKLVHNKTDCFGCRACQQACWDYHDLPAGDNICRIHTEESKEGGNLCVSFALSVCRQCEQPGCLPVCPKKAIYRTEDGILRIDRERCIGCGACSRACPHHGIILSGGKAYKCELCREQKTPPCVAACLLKCIEIR